ncbi:MARF GTPase, partial [Acromyrmex insinuator]
MAISSKKFINDHLNILITNANKGNITIVLNKDSYILKMEEILSDVDTYTIINKDSTKKLIQDLHYRRLLTTDDNIFRTYGLTKIHKTGNPLRVIVSSINSPLYYFSLYLHNIIIKSIPQAPHMVFESNYILASLDVFLFINVPVDLVLNNVVKRFSQKQTFQRMNSLLLLKIQSLFYYRYVNDIILALSSDTIDDTLNVRAQHQERAIDFLSRELKVYSPKDAEERVFFISAKETLQARMQEQRGQPAHNGALAEGFQNRYFEFQDFEKKFEECISKSAVKTKFEQHSQRGKHIAMKIRQTLDEILERTQKMRSEQLNIKKELHDKLNFTEQQLMLLTQEMKDKIHHMVEDVEQKVSKALNEEIRRLAVLIDEFSVPFHPEPLVLNVYKRELHTHVENGLGSNLRARLSTALALNMENSQREMTERMSSLLPENKRQMSFNILPRREPFEIFYRLNCDNLCADFHEDLEFRFSWGFTAIINRFAGKQNQRLTITNYPQEIPPCITSPADSIDSLKFVSSTPNFPTRSDDWSLATRIAVASVTSQGTMGGLIVAGFMLKTVGWRLIAVIGTIYGALYLYERLTWTNKAKEREFKRQYVTHATKKLRLIVDLTSANCSHQVQHGGATNAGNAETRGEFGGPEPDMLRCWRRRANIRKIA